MSEILKAVEVNCTTGEVTERPLTSEEIADRESIAAAYAIAEAERQAEATAVAEAKASGIAKLLALGLTEAEANALIK
jgi:hypothetical protein